MVRAEVRESLSTPLRVRALRALARRALCTGQTRGDTAINDPLKNNVRIHLIIFLFVHNEITNNFLKHKKGEQEAQVQDDDHARHTRRIAAL